MNARCLRTIAPSTLRAPTRWGLFFAPVKPGSRVRGSRAATPMNALAAPTTATQMLLALILLALFLAHASRGFPETVSAARIRTNAP